MRGRTLHAAIQPMAYSGSSSAPKSFPVDDAYRPVSDRKVYLFALCSLVFLLVPQLILINFKRLQRQWGELHGVEILAAVVVALHFLQFILHHLRFRRSHWLVQWGAWAAYYVPMPLEALAVGMTLRLRRPFWPVALLFAAGQSDTMAAYSLDDDSQNMRRFAKRTLYLAYLIVALLQVAPTELCFLLVNSFLVLFVHLRVGSMAMIPSGDICMVAAEGVISRAPSTASQAQGAVVAVGSLESRRSAISGSTTYEDILGLQYSAKLKEVCLSSALFLQLLQRYHNPHQRVDTSSANLAFKELLAREEDRGYARALKLVEVQLSFIYDHFFSVHGSPSSASYKLYWDHCVFKIGFLMHILSLVDPKAVVQQQAEHSTFAVGVIYVLVMLELCQLAHYLTSDRFIVSYMCDRARVLLSSRHSSSPGKPLHMVVLNAISETTGTRWQNTLGQYSLVEDFDCASLGQRLMGRLHGRPQRGTYASPVALSADEVKAWILGKVVILKASGSSWSTASESADPTSSPSRRRIAILGVQPPHQVSWAFRQETTIHTILTWHIATWLCAMRDVNEVLPSSDYMAATRLSSYCAYLVAFHPEFLPGHRTVARRVFDEAEYSSQGPDSPDS
ncbi:hypothetical protein BAE44_0004379 [Dichanthelium oligosanthes]|uniref:DUF4220 domain-containing protein n=1 Tax=Dichanthelium oligosanthes TaxID=888268 RepID=A0A1E5WB32_9POAL|nr:hypothetical protein BAE44_0004379 [Dichanthelium oligosanthes]